MSRIFAHQARNSHRWHLSVRQPLAVAWAALALLSGCNLDQLNFRADERVQFESPSDDARITTPVEVSWTYEDLDLAAPGSGEDGIFFGLFVNRPPMAPGEDVASLADDACQRRSDCPNEEWLADRYVFLTADRSLTLERLPGRADERRNIDLTMVLLDQDGVRINESAFVRSFVAEARR